jgi:hypothetical protein
MNRSDIDLLERLYANVSPPIADLPPSLRSILPLNKSDEVTADKVIQTGYPIVAPILPHIMMWLQDGNWPISKSLALFLASIGDPIIPEIRKVFATDDYSWQWFVIVILVSELPPPVANQLRTDLERLANNPTSAERQNEIDEVARDVLGQFTNRKPE